MKVKYAAASVQKTIARFSLIEFVYYAFGSLLSYQTLFLKSAVGLDSTQIGQLIALCSIAALVVIPVWGVISDKLHSAKTVFGLCILGASLATITVSFFGTFIPVSIVLVYVLFVIKYLFQQPSNSLMDGWVISELTPHNINYSSVRIWGSIGFASFCVLLGLTVGKVITLQTTFRICGGLGLFLAALTFFSPKPQGAALAKKQVRVSDFLSLFKNFKFMMYMLFIIAPNLFVGVTLVYLPYVLEQVKVSGEMIGVFTGVRSGFEVLTMLLLVVLLRKRIAIGYIVVLPGLFGAVEHFLYGCTSGAGLLFVSMALSGLAGGIFYGVGPSYIHDIVDEDCQNTAQTLAAFVMTLVAVLGGYLGGIIITNYGVLVLTRLCGGIMLALSVIFILSQIVTKTPFLIRSTDDT